MSRLPASILSSVLAAALLLPACSPHKVVHNPDAPIELPSSFHSISAEGANLPDRWWQSFGDPQLDKLVNTALSDNLQVLAAWERLEQVKTVTTMAGAARYPSLNVQAAVVRTQETPFNIPSSPLSLNASYEVDLFKSVGNGLGAARTDEMAARDQVESLAMTLVAQIAETWFSLVSQRARLQLLSEQIKTSENFLELAEMRLGQGLGSSLDLLQQRQQLAVVSGQRPLLESAVAVLQNQLALLTGQTPGSIELEVRNTLPELPPLPGAGVPADLLLRRPDVRSARLAVTAADYRVAVAVSNRLPKLRLTGQYGPFTRVQTDFSINPVWNIAASILAPLFQGGRLKAEVRRNEAVVREKSYVFGQTLLQAITEVENALVQERKQVEYIALLEGQLAISKETLVEARARYGAGVGGQSFLQILTALSSAQQIEQTLLTAKQQALNYRISLCRALGGTWTHQLSIASKPQNSSSPNEETSTL